MQDHVHPRETGGGAVLFLSLQGDAFAGLGGDLQQERAGTAGGIVGGGGRDGIVRPDVEHLRDDAADLRRGVELALALATLRGEVPHKILVGISQDVVVLGAVAGEVELWVRENGDEVAKKVHAGITIAELGGIVEIGKVAAGEAGIRVDKRLNDLGVDLIADVAVASERHHVGEASALRYDDGRLEAAVLRVFIGHIFNEQHEQDVVLVLASIHAAAQLIARGPNRGIKIRFLEGHGLDSCQFTRRA